MNNENLYRSKAKKSDQRFGWNVPCRVIIAQMFFLFDKQKQVSNRSYPHRRS